MLSLNCDNRYIKVAQRIIRAIESGMEGRYLHYWNETWNIIKGLQILGYLDQDDELESVCSNDIERKLISFLDFEVSESSNNLVFLFVILRRGAI